VQIHLAFTFATSCCGIEFMATMASHYDLARFGSERVSFHKADMLMVMGTISKKWRLYYVRFTNKCQSLDGLLLLACASSGGILIPIRFYKELIK
jgi:NADH-quinone oxidoreductase subunit B